MRRYDDNIDVEVHVDPEVDDTPYRFAWRGRWYVVEEVIDRWSARRAWWRDMPDDTQVDFLDPALLQDEVYRVLARPRHGSARPLGVYDLAFGQQWRLVGTID